MEINQTLILIKAPNCQEKDQTKTIYIPSNGGRINPWPDRTENMSPLLQHIVNLQVLIV